jgi:peptide/nickel transport system substrate-binding protein
MTDSNSFSRRRFLQATGGAASAAAIAGCTGNPDDSGEETDSGTDTGTDTTEGGEETEVGPNYLQLINSTMSTLDPIKATDTASGRVVQQLFDGLTNYPNGEVQATNLLAEGFELSDDFTTYTFNLKQGVTYHDGTEVTAQDFIYACERLAASSNSRRAYFILDSMGVIHETETVTQDGEEVEQYASGTLDINAPDDYTIEINLEQPFASTIPMLAYSSFALIPEGIVGDIEGYDGEVEYSNFATSEPVGCGPFTLNRWETNTEAIVDRYNDYHGTVADLDGVRWQIIEDTDARFNYANNRNADAFTIPTAQYDPNKLTVEGTDDLGRDYGTYAFDNGSTLDYTGVATINSFYIGFNQANVDEPAVRQAVALALNQQTAVDQVFKGRGSSAYHFTPPNIYPNGANEYRSHAENEYPYGYNESRLDEARSVMEEAGYGPNNRYEVTFTTYQSNSWQQIGQILRDQLTSAHIDMTLEEAPFSTLLQRGRNGNLEMYSLGWVMDWPAPDNFLQNLVPRLTITSQEGGAQGAYVDWQGTEASERANEAWDTITNNPEPTDEAKSIRNEAYVTMEEANWEDVVLLPVYHRIDQLFNYDWVDMPRFGGGGFSRMMLNNVSVGERE